MSGSLSFSEKEDVVKFVNEKGIKIVNLCHVPEDGRLKTLSFSAADKVRLLEILDLGERVDGSSLFSFIDPCQSDMYISPRFDKAFINPFASIPTLNILCDYLDEDGKPLSVAPMNILRRAVEKLRSSTSITMKALAELEFYVISRLEDETLLPKEQDKNYHESAPFARFETIRNEALATLAEQGIATKYGHCEVGRILTRDKLVMEQHEIEFMAKDLEEMADTVTIAKWIVRNVCLNHGVVASFSPKISMEHAGNGMHAHLCATRNNENIVAASDGTLSDEALMMMGGILRFAPSLAAFANTTPVSYLRFIARKESPMHICWSSRNRLALIRIPLWWSHRKKNERGRSCLETFEYRAPDAFANTYLLFAALALAIDYGLQNPEETRKLAENLHVDGGSDKHERLKTLPSSCNEAADNLEKDRRAYEAEDIFPKRLIDRTIEKLKAYDDHDLWKKLTGKPDEVDALLREYLHHG
ncbi:MAG: glutamine synthetase family protein [Candidatus Bathyarchaeia archaeon]|jgi:glutamine synthetase